jgi:O-antigen ligase
MFGYFFGNSRNTFFLLPIWTEMIRVILQNPIHILIGTGMNSLYAERNLGYVNDALTAIWQRYNFVNAHNAYLELFAGLGIFSCILYIYLLVLNFKYLRDFSTFELPLNQKYLITALGAYAFGHATFESLFHPLASGHSNFYIFIFVASSLCAIIDRARLGKIAIT